MENMCEEPCWSFFIEKDLLWKGPQMEVFD